MSGGVATNRSRRPDPHLPVVDDETPGCCGRCALLLEHSVHKPEAVAAFDAVQQAKRDGWLAADANRTGERIPGHER